MLSRRATSSCVALYFLATLTSTVAEIVIVADNDTLTTYLCPPTGGVVKPNTTLVLSQSVLGIEKRDHHEESHFCLMENTSNISIQPSRDLLDSGLSYVTIMCGSNIGFGFFNVTGLTMSSIVFHDCEAHITVESVRYINDSHQFLNYPLGSEENSIALLFNHCYNLKLFNVSVQHSSIRRDYSTVDIVAVNLLGESEIISEDESYPLINVLVYFTDSNLTDKYNNLKCNLSITINTVYVVSDSLRNILDFLKTNPQKMIASLYSDFALYLTQQNFDVGAVLNVWGPSNKTAESNGIVQPMRVILMFVNSVTASHVTFEGLGVPYQLCLESKKNYTLPTSCVLHVIFYETDNTILASDDKVFHPLTIKNTSFIDVSDYFQHDLIAMLQISKLTGKLSHQVTVENIAWCENDLTYLNYPTRYSLFPFHAQNFFFSQSGNLLVRLSGVLMHHNLFNSHLSSHTSSNCLLCLVNVKEAIVEGNSYFYQNVGGSVIRMESSTLALTGNVTINDGNSVEGGGIYLDSASILSLNEPLNATFSRNKAIRGSAIYAPIHACNNDSNQIISAIQIVPSKAYSCSNVTNIQIRIHFENNFEGKLRRSFYAPHFCFLGQQQSKNILFERDTYDYDKGICLHNTH